MNPKPLYRSPGVISLCLILSIALASHGASVARSRKGQRSGWNPAMAQHIHLKASGKVPLLPPDENMEAVKPGSVSEGPTHWEDSNEEDVSGDEEVSGFNLEGISGSDSIDFSDYNYLFPVGKSEKRGDDSQGREE